MRTNEIRFLLISAVSRFVPGEIAAHVDFISVHIYPKSKQPDEAPRAPRECAVGKPVVIEETFPLECQCPAPRWIGLQRARNPSDK